MLGKRYENDKVPVHKLSDLQTKYLDVLNSKIVSGQYEYEKFCCECGNEEDFEVLAEKDRYGIQSRTVICLKCGLIMTNPRMTQKSYDLFYAEEYPYIYRDISAPDDIYFNRRVEYGKTIVRFIEKSVGKVGKDVLEIGCAGGGIVKAFEEAGYHASGIDLSEEYIEYGKSKGLNLECAHSSILLQREKRYDVIILNHVLEHFLDLKEELLVIKKLLKDENSIFFVAVPGVKNLVCSYDSDFLLMLQNAHVYNFTEETLTQVLRWHGFQKIYANEDIKGIYRLSSEEGDVINYSKDIITFLKKIEEQKDNIFPMICKIMLEEIQYCLDNEVVIYGTGKIAKKLFEYIGYHSKIKGVLTNDDYLLREFMNYPVLSENDLNNVKRIIIASKENRDIIYERIKHMEKQGIQITGLYDNIDERFLGGRREDT